MHNPFSWSYLTAPPWAMATWGPFSIALLALFGAGFVAALLVYYDLVKVGRGNRLIRGPVQQASGLASVILGIGLIFFALRIMDVSAFGLSNRLWLYLVTVALIVEALYYVYHFLVVYPPKARALEAQRAKKRYLAPAVAGGSGAARRRSRNKKKR